ncbi:MAG TPA: tetratricopeptide repeat protein [Rhizomicrobium sp.]|nr:tetratricopeptide repeat protein [Rhizomicrobium sp.]
MAELFDRAVALHDEGRLADAEQLYRQVLAADPGNAVVWINLGHVLNGQRQFAPALAAYDRAFGLDPSHSFLHLVRGDLLQRLLRYEEALESYHHFLVHTPDHAETWNGRGLALQNLGRLEEALQSYRRAEALDPHFAAVRLNRGLCHLLMQDFAQGLPLYEWRKRMPQPMEARTYAQPLWTGAEDIRGRILFSYVEQGLGDAIHFYRYVTFALARGARVVLSVPDKLAALLKSASPAVELVGWGQAPPRFDFHIPLASIPLAVDMRADTIPASGRYLAAEPARVARWKSRLGSHGFRIGIAWQGKEETRGLEGKSFPLAALTRIANLPDIRLIRLQKGEGTEQLDYLPAGITVENYDFDEGPDAFLDSAAMIEACDLVITADTAPAHLAGALGAPTWIALKRVPDWRWFLGRGDSPWYASARLFRQRAMGNWDSVFEAMAAELISRRS